MSENSMPKDPDDYELNAEYDLSSMRILPRGRFAPERRAGQNVALRLVLSIAKIPQHTAAEVAG